MSAVNDLLIDQLSPIPDHIAIETVERIAAELHRALNDTADTTAPAPQLDTALHPAQETRRERAI